MLDMDEVNDGVEILLYGCTPERLSVMLRLAGFRYSFLLDVPEGSIGGVGLDPEVEYNIRAGIGGHADFRCESVTRRSLVLYQRKPDTRMLRVRARVSPRIASSQLSKPSWVDIMLCCMRHRWMS